MDEPANELQNLRGQVSQLRWLAMVLLGSALLFLVLCNMTLILMVPNFEFIFEEMLGSKDKLPRLTRFAIEYGKFWHAALPLGLLGSVGMLAFVLVATFRRSILAVLFAAGVMVALVVHAWVLSNALLYPLLQIARGVGEKT